MAKNIPSLNQVLQALGEIQYGNFPYRTANGLAASPLLVNESELYFDSGVVWHAGNLTPHHEQLTSNLKRTRVQDGAYASLTDGVTGSIQIALPHDWNNTYLVVRIRGHEYSPALGAWEAVVGGLIESTGSSWANVSASTNFGRPPFQKVRFGHDGTRPVIVLGNATDAHNRATVEIVEVLSKGPDVDWSTGWSTTLSGDESGITVSSERLTVRTTHDGTRDYLSIPEDRYILFGPNANNANIQFGGPSQNGDHAVITTSNGNVHIDARPGTYLTYLNLYSGTGGVAFGSGGGSAVAWMSSSGQLYKGSVGNTSLPYSLSSHTHDDRYYTESEVNTLLTGKSDTSHLHDDRYYTETEVDTFLAGKSDTSHLHDSRYYTESEVNTLLAGKSDTGHTHTHTTSVTVTVGTGGDFSTLNAALTYLTGKYLTYQTDTVRATINLLSGFVMAEQVLIQSLNLGWIEIIGDDQFTTVSEAALTRSLSFSSSLHPLFGAENGAVLPKISHMFEFDGALATSDLVGVLITNGSYVTFSGGSTSSADRCGIKGAAYGLYVIDGSCANNTGSYTEFTYASQRAITTYRSTIKLSYPILNNCGSGIYGDVSIIDVMSPQLRYTANRCIELHHCLADIANSDFSYSRLGVLLNNTNLYLGTANFSAMSDGVTALIIARYLSHVNVHPINTSGSSNAVTVEFGSMIHLSSNLNNLTRSDAVALNTWDAAGAVFHY